MAQCTTTRWTGNTKKASLIELLGKTITKINTQGWTNLYNGIVTIHCKDGTRYCFYHKQDCCEHVYLEDICGDLNDLLNSPVLLAEAVSNAPGPVPQAYTDSQSHTCSDTESYEWTFYKLATIKGGVTLRFLGTSNGCYAIDVEFLEVVE